CFELVGYPAGYIKRNFKASTRHVSSNNAFADVLSNNATTDTRTNNSHVSLYNEHLSRLMGHFNDNDVFYANANIAANQHMIVSTKKLINVMDISNLGLTVGHPNGTQALITKIGDLKINNDITLYDVLAVPEYTVSLLYVHKITRDSKLFVRFDDTKCYIRDSKSNKTVGIGNQCNCLSLFDVDNACKVLSNNCIASCYVSKSLWHQRLGHPADQILDVLKSAINLDGQSVYDHLFNSESADLPVNTVRRYSRHTKLHTSLNDFIIDGKVKYGVEIVVNYANVSSDNLCFASSLNKSVEPTCYEDAILANNWIDAMNVEIKALNKNQTWIITDLPANRKPISCKWIFKLNIK
ncbi:ribonuclease H-like domain-containing protein, partial [Tanacetum coccineum]